MGTDRIAVVLAMLLGVSGCASSGDLGSRDHVGATMLQAGNQPSVRIGASRVVDPRLDPLAPIDLTSEGESISIRFTHPRAVGALVRLDSHSLESLSPEESAPAGRRGPRATGPARAALRDGRLIVCWKQGNAEWGYNLMAQATTADGSPLGAPIQVSPPESDVFGAPEVVSIDGERAVATFAASLGDRFELLAVSLSVR